VLFAASLAHTAASRERPPKHALPSHFTARGPGRRPQCKAGRVCNSKHEGNLLWLLLTQHVFGAPCLELSTAAAAKVSANHALLNPTTAHPHTGPSAFALPTLGSLQVPNPPCTSCCYTGSSHLLAMSRS
jgi:hypothetical protein